MVKIEVGKSQPLKVNVSETTIDINQIMNKVKEKAANVSSPTLFGQPIDMKLDGFNFSVGKSNRNYKLGVVLELGIKRKPSTV